MIRHVTEKSNVQNGVLIDPTRVKHAIVTALKISELSGWIDEKTHLNLDEPDHLMQRVYIADKLEIGGDMIIVDDKFSFANVDKKDFINYGKVDIYESIEKMRTNYKNDLMREMK